MTIGKRILEARKLRQIGRPQLAELAGIPYPTLAGIENGDQAGTTQLPALAKVLRVRPYWLQTGEGSMEDASQIEVEDAWMDIKATTQGIGLGKGVEADEHAEMHKLKFRADSLRRKRLNPNHLEVAYGKGDSMLPRIHDGDAIMFDRSDTHPRDGALFVIQVSGTANLEPQAKRCLVLDELVYFEAINPEGDHEWRKARRMDAKRQPIEILGRVRWIGSWED